MLLQGKKIFLRSIQFSDADILFQWENDRSNWHVSGTKKPFTKKEINAFIETQKDIYLDKQLRLIIERIPNPKSQILNPIGCIDLFEFDGKKTGVGILIDKKYRKKGYASDTLRVLIKYSFEVLNLRELHCRISEDNIASIRLFQKHNFKDTSKKKDIYCFELQYK